MAALVTHDPERSWAMYARCDAAIA
jgi:hypothetical protein